MDSLLRDIDRERSKMQTDVDNLYRHYGKLQEFVGQYIEQTTVEWAKLVVSHPKAVLLLVETTHIVDGDGNSYGGDEPIRFTVLSPVDGEIWDLLLHPTYSQGVKGTAYHGLTMEDLEDKPRFADAWPKIAERLEGRHIVVFGADWARRALQSVRPTYAVGDALDGAFCLQNKCKEYYSEFYDLSLEKILSYQGIDKKREQLTDGRERILMLAQVVHNLANGMGKQTQESEDSVSDLSDRPF